VPDKVQVRLKPGRDKAVKQGHPWLFSGAIAAADGPEDAPLATVVDAEGRPLGTGLYSPRSQIRVRLLAGAPDDVDRGFFAARLTAAQAWRAKVVGEGTTGYRVLNAEGDGVPGWTVDRFGDVLVSQITVAGLERLREEAYAALAELFPDAAVVQLNAARVRAEEGLGQDDEVVRGVPPPEAPFTESGLRFTADLAAGQKTGFYLDQRDNRRQVERLAAGRAVLDLFAHSGAFGVYALRGGASSVTAVESSERAIARGREHVAANGFAADAVDWVRANVFEDLRQRRESYGLVVCDPPPLATRRAHLEAGARAYKDLNRLALRRVEPGGFFFTFSCSAAVDAKLFRQVLFAAAVEAGVDLGLLAPLAAAPDHPVAVTHPQGEYLKGWWGVVR
jgi:23S rRNA (cytosine1962-C5)-methyltransferase